MDVRMSLCKPGSAGKSTGPSTVRQGPRPHGRKVSDFTLPGKTSKEFNRRSYLKPTQVDKVNIHRRSRERSLRN
jgi:hypothetical protein